MTVKFGTYEFQLAWETFKAFAASHGGRVDPIIVHDEVTVTGLSDEAKPIVLAKAIELGLVRDE